MTPHRNDWRTTTVLFSLTSLIESLAFGHLSAFTPLYLQQLHVAQRDVPFWTGMLSALAFVIGLPLLPFWGAWAERYGRKLMIVRSSVAAALIYAGSGASRDVWMLAATRLLGGFVFGNTGIMMALQAEIAPRNRLGQTVALISAGAPVGMAVGPYAGGLVVERWGIRALLYTDAALTVLVALALVLFLHEEPRRVAGGEPQRAGAMALAAIKGVLHTPALRTLFTVVFLMAFGISASQPYVPILIQRIYHGTDLASVIGAVLSGSGIAMALATPLWGRQGDRVGHRKLVWLCAPAVMLALGGQAIAMTVAQVAAFRVAQGAFMGGLSALAIVLLALYTPAARRSSVLNFSLLPQQFAWFLGPVAGSWASERSVRLPFWMGAAGLLAGWALSLTLPEPPLADHDEDAEVDRHNEHNEHDEHDERNERNEHGEHNEHGERDEQDESDEHDEGDERNERNEHDKQSESGAVESTGRGGD